MWMNYGHSWMNFIHDVSDDASNDVGNDVKDMMLAMILDMMLGMSFVTLSYVFTFFHVK